MTTLTAHNIFGDNWRKKRQTDAKDHLRRNYRRSETAQIYRVLNLLARQIKQDNQLPALNTTLGDLAGLAASELAGRVSIENYGPVSRIIALKFFSENSEQQAASATLPLSVGYYTPTETLNQICRHIAVMDAEHQPVALVVPVGDQTGVTTARLLAAAPELLLACKLAHDWLTERAGEQAPAAAVEKIRAAIGVALGDDAWQKKNRRAVTSPVGRGTDSPSCK